MVSKLLKTACIVLPIIASGLFAETITTYREAEHTDGGASGIVWNGWYIGSCDNGNWAAYSQVNLRDGADELRIRLASGHSTGSHPGNIEVRMDGADGQLIGTLNVAGTGSWSNWEIQNTALNGATGTHDIFLVFKGVEASHGICDLDWLEIDSDENPTPPPPAGSVVAREGENYSAQQGTQIIWGPKAVGHIDNGDWLKYNSVDLSNGALYFTATIAKDGTAGSLTNGFIEIHTDAVDGELLGYLEVKATGGWYTYQDQSVELYGNGAGIHDLYLVFYDSWGICNLDNFEIVCGEGVEIENPELPVAFNWGVQANDDIMVWTGSPAPHYSSDFDPELYMRDNSGNITRITESGDPASSRLGPTAVGVMGNVIVFEMGKLYTIDNGVTSEIPQSNGATAVKVVDNTVVWKINSDVYRYHNGSTSLVATDIPNPFDASGTFLVYADWDGNDLEIYLNTGSSEVQLTNNSYRDSDARISGDYVTWLGYDAGDKPSVFLYTISTGVAQKISTRNDYWIPESDLVISGSHVAWSEFNGNALENSTSFNIQYYNGTGLQQIATDNPRAELRQHAMLRLKGGKIAWLKADFSGDYHLDNLMFFDGSDVIDIAEENINYFFELVQTDSKLLWVTNGYNRQIKIATVD